jgi:putative membrane protein
MKNLQTQHLKSDLRVKDKANAESRDRLAEERTELANERTFLAYLRTAMGFVLAGFSLIQFFRHQVFIWVGVLIVPVGFFVGIVGLRRYLEKRRFIRLHRNIYQPTSSMHAHVAEMEKRDAENAAGKTNLNSGPLI